MTDKPVKRDPRLTTKTLAAMAMGKPLHKLEAVCEQQKTIAVSRVARMVEEAQDILKDYAYTLNSESEASRAAGKARIAGLEQQHHRDSSELRRLCADRDSFQRVGIEAITASSDALELLRAIHSVIHCDTLPGNLYQRLELMLFPTQQGKEGGT